MTISADITRREEVLAAAVSEMRQRGVLATRLQDIAERLGISYTTLYHYFPGRNPLVQEVLLWTIEQRRESLTAAQGHNALEKLLDFVWRDLSAEPNLKVAMPFLGAFPKENRTPILRQRTRLLKATIELIQQGIDEGSIRPCHAETIGELTINYLERFVSFDPWLATAAHTKDPLRISREVVETLRHGILAPGVEVVRPSYDIPDPASLTGTPQGISPDYDRYEQVLRVATRAFNTEGADASIPRMALELGVSKTVIYHYATDKRDLLAQCYLRGVRILELSHHVAASHSRDVIDEIYIHRNNLFRFHGSAAGPFTMLNALGYLHPQQRRILDIRNAAMRGISERRLQRGIDEGAVRGNVDPQIAQALFGQALYGLPAWYGERYPLSVMEVAQESGLLLMKGLQPGDQT